MFVCLSVCLSITPRRRLKLNKSQKEHSGQNWKILRMAFSNNSKVKNDPKNTPKPKHKKFKKPHKEASNKKVLKTNYS